MGALVRLAALLLVLPACRATPEWEPVGGFELVPSAAEWRDLSAAELRAWLEAARAQLTPVKDYTGTLETRERIGDDLHPRRVMHIQLREQPFAVAIETLEPASEAGQRVWYDESRSRELVAETPGFLGKLVGHVSLDPEGDLAMENRRHAITDTGLTRLLEQVEEEFVPALARRPRLRVAELAFGDTPLRVVDAVVPREPPDPPLVQRLGFQVEGGLLTYYGLAELLPDGLALVEEYAYRDLVLDPGLAPATFAPPK
ncbi:MAG TPA: DUF1571 domain-containing protein [Planctomycetota bacterium]